jgi:hypothetical protein
VEKHDRSGHATGDKKWCMGIACWIPKAADTYSEHVILLLFFCNNAYAKRPQCDVTRTLPVMCNVAIEVRIFGTFQEHVSENSMPPLRRKSNLCQLKTKNGPALWPERTYRHNWKGIA